MAYNTLMKLSTVSFFL